MYTGYASQASDWNSTQTVGYLAKPTYTYQEGSTDMANFTATITLIDGKNRQCTKRFETETDVLATAQAAVATLVTNLEAITDLGVVIVTYSNADDTEASAADAASNIDTGATFRCRLDNGKIAAHKVPGFPLSKVQTGGNIDVEDADVAAYFANFEAAGAFTLSDGQVITAVLSGMLDK